MGDGAGGLIVDAPAPPADAPAPGTTPTTTAGPTGTTLTPTPAPTSAARRRWQVWRSPDDQPAWARPALLVVAALAALSYVWGIGNAQLETFYAGAVRSMSESWHNFLFGAFDPWGTVSVDKLPGAFFVQALSVRLFGFHIWSVALPQAIEGVLTVLVLYRAVRRIGGPVAGLVAALVMAATPVTILVNRGNVSDSLLVLLLVLAADAATSAFLSGRLRTLLLSGVWVGLAFQAKMLQAWIVVPALLGAYLVAAPVTGLVRRLGHVVLAGLVVVAVSLSYICLVSVVPAHDRPYVDGSCNDSIVSQVFLYNGADRLSGQSLRQPGCSLPPASVTSAQTTTGGAPTVALGKGPGRFLNGLFGRDAAWFLPPALIALIGILVARRKEPETDPWRAGALLWGVWMLFTWAFFASSHFLNAYYLAALVPPLGALCGLGVALAWRHRSSAAVRLVLMATVVIGVAYAVYLVPTGVGMRGVIVGSGIALGLAAVLALARSLTGAGRRGSASDADRRGRWAFALAVASLLVGAVWASGTAVATELGPFDSPYQPAAQTAAEHAGWNRDVAGWPALAAAAASVPAGRSVETAETSAQVSQDVLATGREYLPVGGFTGQVPATSVRQLEADVRAGTVEDVLVSVAPRTRNPAMEWAAARCHGGTLVHEDGATYRRVVCLPSDATP
jgi:4-amino-4-deoxy-L-arabinose transferase-like glycosyltransferase